MLQQQANCRETSSSAEDRCHMLSRLVSSFMGLPVLHLFPNADLSPITRNRLELYCYVILWWSRMKIKTPSNKVCTGSYVGLLHICGTVRSLMCANLSVNSNEPYWGLASCRGNLWRVMQIDFAKYIRGRGKIAHVWKGPPFGIWNLDCRWLYASSFTGLKYGDS
jgi:hypothetical protein